MFRLPGRLDTGSVIEPDPVGAADALCAAPGRAEFLSIDLELVRALEDVLEALPAGEAARRARVAARLALELRSDPTTMDRRRALLRTSRAAAAEAADPAASVDAELAGVHALWEPAAAQDRLAAAEQAVAQARSARLGMPEVEARMARVDALLGLGRLGEAEIELATYVRLAPSGDPGCRLFAASRRVTLCAVRGRFEEAERAAAEAEAAAAASDRGDLHQVLLTVRGTIDRYRGAPRWTAGQLDAVAGLVVRLPGQHHDAVLARMLVEAGHLPQARIELARAIASLRAGRGPMWLAALYDAAVAAVDVGRNEDRAWLLAQLEACGADFATYTFWFGGSTRAGRGALALALGRPEVALAQLDRAVADLDAVGAIPLAARARHLRAKTLRALNRDAEAEVDERDAAMTADALGLADLVIGSAGRDTWSLTREHDGWRLVAGPEDIHLSHSRGLDHVRALVANPRHEIAAIVLEAGGEPVPSGAGTPMVDEAARAAYRARLARLADELDAAERRGDAPASMALEAERAAIVAELKRAVGLGGRVRRDPDAAERARINVTRSIRRAIDRIGQLAPQAGLHLAASIRTGTVCRYEPAPGGPAEWKLS